MLQPSMAKAKQNQVLNSPLKFKKSDQLSLLNWFNEYHRPLPWREKREPYSIWISETMLQQTTSTAVVPFFKNFLSKFPTLDSLAKSTEADVLEAWAGLGYYSRARNLRKAAQLLNKEPSFPKTFEELLQYPGIGPYTSRAVASIAFDQPVGVLDGNVIRILTRKFDLDFQWWKSAPRKELQRLADLCVNNFPAHQMNQAMMELGATICTPTSPKCLTCPWVKSCKSRNANTIQYRPVSRPKKTKEIWVWKPHILNKKGAIALSQENQTPFLKKQWLPPGEAHQVSTKPKKFDFSHSITHYQIYVIVQNSKQILKKSQLPTDTKWVLRNSVAKWNPSSLVQKALQVK